jgi:hypothetical protein
LHAKEKKPSKTDVKKWIFWLVVFFISSVVYIWLEDIPEIPPLPDPNALTAAHSAADSVRPEDILNTPEDYLYPRTCTQQNATIADLAKCYPEAPLQQPWLYQGKEGCIAPPKLTWPFLRDCISGQRTTNKKITQIHVIGERNSGTKWLQQELEKCFPRSNGVRSHRDFLRSKHFFQPPSRGNFETSLVVSIARDPLEWVAAMREKPYHMPQHMKGFDASTKLMPAIPLEWEDFTSRPWKLTQITPDDLQIIKTQQTQTIRCSQGFAFDEVSPCYFDNSTLPRAKWRGHVPIYELRRDHSGQAFADLLKLRSDKALNFFLEVPLLMHLGGFLAVRYDDLVREGTRSFLEKVATLLGMPRLPSHCHPQGPHPERLGKRIIPPAFRKWIEERLVLETEQMLGFR